jgi:pimeloyl-ACP methyl ester carboxylesterase
VFRSRLIPAVQPTATTLAVFVHGWGSSSHRLHEVVTLLREIHPEADGVLIDHDGSRIFSNARPEVIADEIAQEIEYRWEDGSLRPVGYEKIILLGHSAGALLVRKAYAFAWGFADDSEAQQGYTWAPFVDRIVCLAGLDRGLSFVTKPVNMMWPTYVVRRVAYNVARLTRSAQFLRALQRGEPFVTNLRIQWIRMMQWPELRQSDEQFVANLRLQWIRMHLQGEDVKVAPTFQLVGDRDVLVSRSDSIDSLFKSSSYVYRSVIGADHAAILRPSESGYVRREIVNALTSEPNRDNTYNDSKMTDIFYVIHGIRDLGSRWTPPVCAKIRETIEAANAATPPGDPCRLVRTVRPSYGYFSMLSFLLSWDRQKNVRWFMDLYTQMVARYPRARHHYIGHSNGTYLLASALQRYATCRVRNVVFAGSVVPSAYDWTKMFSTDQVAYVRNDVGSADWVVAWFPHLFEFAADVLSRFDVDAPKWLDLGGAGFNGFYDDLATSNKYLPGDHCAALNQDNYSSMALSAVGGKDVDPCAKVDSPNPLVELISKLSWLVVPVAAGALFALLILAWLRNPWIGAGVTALFVGLLYTL